MTSLATAFVDIRGDTSRLGPDISRGAGTAADRAGADSGKRFSSRFGSALKVGALLAGAFAVTKGIQFLGGAIAEATEASKVTAQTAAVIKSMGGAAGVSAGQVAALSTSLSNQAGIDDELIQKGANVLLTFRNIRNEAGKGNDIFSQSTAAALDLSVALGKDMSSSAIMVGKALNDPVKGLTALGRAGVQFTDGQKKAVAQMVRTGDVMGAQKIILKELDSQFAGSAAAQATPAEKARVAWDNLKETIGVSLLPVVEKLSTVFTNRIAPAITTFITGMQNGTGAGGVFAGVMSRIGAAVMTVGTFLANNLTAFAAFIGIIGTAVVAGRAFAVVMGIINVVMAANPIGIVVVAIAALVAGLIYAYKHSETFRNIVNGAFNAVRNVVASVIGWLGSWVPAVFARVVGAVRGYVNAYRAVVTAAFNAARAVVTTAVNAIRAAVSAAFNVVRAVVSAVSGAVRAAMSAIGAALRAAGQAAGAFASTMKAKIGDAIGFIKSIPGKAKSALGNLGGILVAAGSSLISGLLSGITAKFQAVLDKVRGMAGAVKGAFGGSPVEWGPLKSWNNTGPTGPGGQLVSRLISGIDSQGPALTASVSRLASRVSVPRLAVDASAGASGRAGAGSGAALVNIEQMITHDPREAAYRLRVEQSKALALAGLP